MKIELDKQEYENLQKQYRNIGFNEGYMEAKTMVYCKKNPNWKTGDLHFTTKGLEPFCLVCMNKAENPPKPVDMQKIADSVSELFNNKFPPKDPQRYKSNDLYSKVMNLLGKELTPPPLPKSD